jgi:hypothetical protein
MVDVLPVQESILNLKIFNLHILTCVYIICATSPPASLPLLGRTCSALFFDFVEKKTSEVIRKTYRFC